MTPMSPVSPHERSSTPAAEWITAAIGAGLIALTLMTLIYEAVTDDAAPPELTADVVAVSPVTGGYRVEFRVGNGGARTAADVQVSGEVRIDGSVVEHADAVIDYVAAESVASGALQFTLDPRRGELSLRITGYQDP